MQNLSVAGFEVSSGLSDGFVDDGVNGTAAHTKDNASSRRAAEESFLDVLGMGKSRMSTTGSEAAAALENFVAKKMSGFQADWSEDRAPHETLQQR